MSKINQRENKWPNENRTYSREYRIFGSSQGWEGNRECLVKLLKTYGILEGNGDLGRDFQIHSFKGPPCFNTEY